MKVVKGWLKRRKNGIKMMVVDDERREEGESVENGEGNEEEIMKGRIRKWEKRKRMLKKGFGLIVDKKLKEGDKEEEEKL